MKKIKLTQSKYALVDNEDYKELNNYKWYAQKTLNTFYANTNIKVNGNWTPIRMHRLLTKPLKSNDIDHIDGNGLNNQRKNLRICTHSENLRNRGKTNKNTSGYKGVSYDKINKKFMAHITYQGKLHHLGRFSTKEEAYKSYCKACLKYHKEFAKLS